MPWNRKDYPADWEERRKRILKRARNRCEGEGCGLANHVIICKQDRRRPSYQQWDMYHSLVRAGYSKNQAMRRMGFTEIVLTIAHLDHDNENWEVSDDRLRALCQRCHLSHDRSRHIANIKYGRNHTKNQFKLW